MAKWKSGRKPNEKGLAVTGLTSSTVADDSHTESNQGSSRQHRNQNRSE